MESALKPQLNLKKINPNSEEKNEQTVQVTDSFCYFSTSNPDVVSTAKVCVSWFNAAAGN